MLLVLEAQAKLIAFLRERISFISRGSEAILLVAAFLAFFGSLLLSWLLLNLQQPSSALRLQSPFPAIAVACLVLPDCDLLSSFTSLATFSAAF